MSYLHNEVVVITVLSPLGKQTLTEAPYKVVVIKISCIYKHYSLVYTRTGAQRGLGHFKE